MKRRSSIAVVLLLSLLLAGCLGGSKEYSLSGVVQDGLGIPVAGVELKLEGPKIPSQVLGPTGEDGRWSASGLQGTVTLEVLDKEGWFFKPRTQEFTKGADNVVIEAVKGEPLVIVVEGEGRVEQEVVFSPLDTDYYPRTTEVKLTAVPDFDWVFLRWEGDVPEGEEEKNPITVVMDGPKEIKAFFVEPISVSVSVEMFHDFPQAYEQLVGAPSPEGRPARLPLADPTEDEEWRESARENEFIVMLDRVLSRQEQVSILEAAGYRVLDTIECLGAHLVVPLETELMALSGEEHLEVFRQLNGFVAAHLNYDISLQAIKTPNDPFYAQYQWWNYDQIRLPQAWAVTTGDPGVRIAVIDTGIDPDHPDLEAKIDLENAWDFTEDNDIEDGHGHGTHVAGTIGAATNNEQGVAGIMWEVELLPVKVFDASGRGSTWTVVQGMLYAAGLLNEQEDKPTNPRPADIMNMSLGGPYTELQEDAVAAIAARGVIMVAATGNGGRPVISYPAAYPEVIAVGATASGLHLPDPYEPPLAPYSNYGPEDFVVAPGGGGHPDLGIMDFVVSTGDNGSYYGSIGTSMAAPHVSGVIGLMLANGIPKSQVRDVLERTAMKIHKYDSYHFGHGLINAYWAVNAVEEIRLIQGFRQGTEISAAVEERLPLPGHQALFYLKPGEYQLIAWVDVNGNGVLDAGDYYSETEVLEFEYGQGWSWWPTLSEFHPADLEAETGELQARLRTYSLTKD